MQEKGREYSFVNTNRFIVWTTLVHRIIIAIFRCCENFEFSQFSPMIHFNENIVYWMIFTQNTIDFESLRYEFLNKYDWFLVSEMLYDIYYVDLLFCDYVLRFLKK